MDRDDTAMRNELANRLEPFEPLMDDILEKHYDAIDGAETAYDELGTLDKARYLVGMVTGEHRVREARGPDENGVVYHSHGPGGAARETTFSIPELYGWLQSVSGRPHTGEEPFEEMRDLPPELRNGNEDRLVDNLNREPQYEVTFDGVTDEDVTWPDPNVGTREGTTLDFDPW